MPCYKPCDLKGEKDGQVEARPTRPEGVGGEGRMIVETGAWRSADTGRGRYDLLPPAALERWAKRMEWGAKKYGDRNWEKGLPMARFLNSAFRHLAQYMAGDTTEDHLAAVLFNVGGLMFVEAGVHSHTLPPSLADFPFPPAGAD